MPVSQQEAERKHIYCVRNPARGRPRNGMIQVCVRFDTEMMESLRATAKREGRGLTEVVRTYCQWGIDAESGGGP